jgi:hypothetical protein
VIVGAGAAVGTYLLWVLWHPAERWVPLRRLAMSAAALLISVALGATHFGVFLPRSMQENVKVPVLSPGSHVRLRPYFLYVVTHWTDPRWNRMAYINPPSDKYTDVYLSDSSDAEPLGRAAVVTRWVCLFEMDFWASLRLYGFLPLGLMLMGQTLYSRCPIGTWSDYKSLLVWFWVALFSFSIGYAIAFLFELGYMKWWLSRFLVPGVVVCLVGLVLALARPAGEPWPRMRRAAWTLCIVIGTFGPAVEFCQTFYNNWIGSAKTDPFAHRLNLLVEATGPFN